MGNDFTTYSPRAVGCGEITGDVDARPAIVGHTAPFTDPLTERSHRIWSAGDYDRIAAGFRHEAESFVERQSLTPANEVLDLACGSGNLTIPAARTGASVTGFDIVPSLLDATADWAARERLDIRLDQGTVEELPYADASFDVVISMFGTMFAARPDRVAAELARVTRPGGRVALANWTRDGFIGQLLATHVAYVTPPAGIPSVLLWGDESAVRERLSERDWVITTTLRTLTFIYPYTPAGTAELFVNCYGPTVRTLESLDKKRGRQLQSDLLYLWERHQRAGALGTQVDSQYLEVIATRR
ncbi:MAG TPA: class I SAM-dependent methyltransferase [Gemmatimonadaceae bacterium]|nr:class I SAM-dependent methyltransferase [Gemmatimonadaceae bacterium]